MRVRKEINRQGTVRYYNSDNQLHREGDQPAIIYANGGGKEWYKNGQLHREGDKPAIINSFGHKFWYTNNQFHRENGPAVIYPATMYAEEVEAYYLRNIALSKEEHYACISHTLTILQIENAPNIEKRRLFISYYGLEKYIQDSGSFLIAEDNYGQLYIKPQMSEEAITMVRVRNSTPELDGSYKFYFIRVPPNIKTPKQAIAWTFGMNEEEYSPSMET